MQRTDFILNDPRLSTHYTFFHYALLLLLNSSTTFKTIEKLGHVFVILWIFIKFVSEINKV